MEKTYDDTNWREEYKGYTNNKRYINYLRMDQRVFLRHGYWVHYIMNGKELKDMINLIQKKMWVKTNLPSKNFTKDIKIKAYESISNVVDCYNGCNFINCC